MTQQELKGLHNDSEFLKTCTTSELERQYSDANKAWREVDSALWDDDNNPMPETDETNSNKRKNCILVERMAQLERELITRPDRNQLSNYVKYEK